MTPGLRSHFRDWVANLLLATGAIHPARRLRGCLAILTFHRVLPESELRTYPLPGLCVTPAELEWLLRFFGGHFRCGSLAESIRNWEAEPDAAQPNLAITFDDGQLDNWRHARPVLDRLGMKASFFVPLDSVENGQPLWHDRVAWAVRQAALSRPVEAARLAAELQASPENPPLDPHRMVELAKALPMAERERYVERWENLAGKDGRPDWDGFMGWDELRALAALGHEIGSHSMSHAILPLCTSREIEREVRESRRILESRLDLPIESFCYPNGDFDSRCTDAVRESGYRQAVTTQWGANQIGDERTQFRRFDMRSDHARDARGTLSTARVAWRISGTHPGLR